MTRLGLTLGFALLPCSLAFGQAPAYYAGRLGTDTLYLEVVRVTESRVEGVVVYRTPQLETLVYAVELEGGLPSTWRVQATAVQTGRQVTIDGRADGAIAELVVTRTGRADTVRFGELRLPVFPYSPPTIGLYELITRWAVRAGLDSVPLLFAFPGARRPLPNAVVRVRSGVPAPPRGPGVSGAFDIGYPGGFHRLEVDSAGRVLRLDASATTTRLDFRSTIPFNPDSVVAAWQGRAAGPLAPRDTVRAAIGSGEIVIDYGRPSKRGRTIFGGLVPYGEVWRTGANAATHFSTPVDLLAGDSRIPAGRYTLFTIPDPERPTLIVNRQVGQWGTAYDPGKDLVRIPMTSRATTAAVERLTIRIQESGTTWRLVFEWDSASWEAVLRMASPD
jgi:hypothetical protein